LVHCAPQNVVRVHAPKVYLVGAGPGDPDLLTVKADRILRQARVVVHDRLVAEGILALAPADAQRIYVGKAKHCHPVRQEQINHMLADLAVSHGSVVRLKGGDPFVFGRGSEEAEYLVRRGIACEVVPGITAAAGCAASAGIPLTHRGLATGVQFITGHARDYGELDIDWDRLADPMMTKVVYMGLATVGRVSARLVRSGLDPETPAAAISNGTTDRQRVCVTTIGNLAREIERAGLLSPVLLVIGRVVELAAVLGSATENPPGEGWMRWDGVLSHA
jgi:uroporphyrin-III C-methyltransferase